MATLTYQNQLYEIADGKSVLEILEDNQIPVLSSCRQGVCQSCVKKVINGNVSTQAQAGLKATEQALGYFLPCVCYPESDLEIEDVAGVRKYQTQIISIKHLNADIAEIQLISPANFGYMPGQYIQVFKDEYVMRTYSLASVPQLNEPLTLHVRKVANGKVSSWLHEIKANSSIEIAGALGNCFYQTPNKNQQIIMISTGSGLAPHYGIIRQALLAGHVGQIHLFHGVEKKQNLYLENELRSLMQQYKNFSYTPCLSAEENEHYAFGMVLDVVKKQVNNFKDSLVFLCGHPEMVKKANKHAFLAGARLQDIYADPFV